MDCPKCNAPSRVLETRMGARRRECENKHRYWTEEVLVRLVPNKTNKGILRYENKRPDRSST